MRVLVIEDDQMVSGWMRDVLDEAGYLVEVAATADEGRALALTSDFDILLVDLDLPDRSGLGVVFAVRRAGITVPIMIVTGRADEDGIVNALDAGADDYLVKPVPNGVLRARVRAALRRGGRVKSDALVSGNVELDRLQRRARAGTAELSLTAREFALLEHFMLRPDEVVGRADLLERVWGMRFDTATNVIDATVCRLRQKLTRAGATAALRTVRGAGFALSAR